MTKPFQTFRYYRREFSRHWLAYLSLVYSLDLVLQYGVFPLQRFLTTMILEAAAIPFVSLRNLGLITLDHPLAVAGLLVEGLALLAILYALLALCLIGIRLIAAERFGWRKWLRESGRAVAGTRLGGLIHLLLALAIALPLADLIFKTPLLAKTKVPEFALDYLSRNPWIAAGSAVGYLLAIYLGCRLSSALPRMILDQQSSWTATKQSWQATKNGAWHSRGRQLLGFTLTIAALAYLTYGAAIGLQVGFDRLPKPGPAVAATVLAVVVQVISQLLATLQWVGLVGLCAQPLPAPADQSAPLPRGSRLAAGLLMIALIAIAASDAWQSFSTPARRPITIAHRGVADDNGVQNSLVAMRRTHRLHPDYVEMDVHETKDHRFVVIHDENLRALTKVNRQPHQLTLAQLTKLTAKEDGHHAKLVSLDRYLKVADQLHQKLIVEIKTTPADSAGMLARFNRRYGRTLVAHHDLVHSLDYRVVTKLRRLNPKLKVLYVQPYNFTLPNPKASGYSMEYSTLTRDFINRSHAAGKPIYAWTVNNPLVVSQLIDDRVDGIITDDLPMVQRELKKRHSMAERLVNYLDLVPW